MKVYDVERPETPNNSRNIDVMCPVASLDVYIVVKSGD